jgi:hypothetical protein
MRWRWFLYRQMGSMHHRSFLPMPLSVRCENIVFRSKCTAHCLYRSRKDPLKSIKLRRWYSAMIIISLGQSVQRAEVFIPSLLLTIVDFFRL